MVPAPGCAIVLPAAGGSTRMRGADKLLEPVEGLPLLRRQATAALATGAEVAVTLRPGDVERRAALAGLNVTVIEVAQAAEGMAASLRAGADWAEARGAGALMVVLPDMPDLAAEDFVRLRDAWRAVPDQPVRATDARGTPGHPVVFPARLFASLHAVTGDQGARTVLDRAPPRLLALPGLRALTDLDTPEAWARWRAGRETAR